MVRSLMPKRAAFFTIIWVSPMMALRGLRQGRADERRGGRLLTTGLAILGIVAVAVSLAGMAGPLSARRDFRS
jgi:hypothetical protein